MVKLKETSRAGSDIKSENKEILRKSVLALPLNNQSVPKVSSSLAEKRDMRRSRALKHPFKARYSLGHLGGSVS